MAGTADKKALRKRLLAQRLELAASRPEIEREIGRRLAAWLEAHPEIASVGIYSPIKGEPDLRPELEEWRSRRPGRRLALPVVEEGAMRYLAWAPGDAMEPDAWGIPIPAKKEGIAPDAVLGPCVGFTSAGYRLGYGGGWFDRMLSKMNPRPVTVAVAYEAGKADGEFEPEEHDIAFGWIATERGVRAAAS